MANIIEIVAKFINEASGPLKQVGEDIEGVGNKTKETTEKTDGFGFSLSDLASKLGMTLSVAGLLTTAFSFLKSSIDAYGEAEVVAAQVEAVLRSTKEQAGVTAEEIDNLADSLSRMSGVDDEVIKRGEALMLTFTRIGDDVFPKAIEASLNLSMAMGTDLQSSIIQVGKALNDPIEGVSALRRVGVQLSDQQEEQIRHFIEINDVASAQKIILAELETQFGGVAEMMGDTVVGSTNKLKVAWGNFMETVGEDSAGTWRETNESLTKFVDNLTIAQRAARASEEAIAKGVLTAQEYRDMQMAANFTGTTWAEVLFEIEQRMLSANEVFRTSKDDIFGVAEATVAASGAIDEYTPKFDQLLSISTRLAAETERYNDSQDKLLEKQAAIRAEIDLLIAQGWSPLSDKVRDLQADYDELGVKYEENAIKHNETMNRIQYDLLITKLSVDGLTDAEFGVAQQAGLMFGIFDQKSVDTARNMDLVAQAVNTGRLKVEDMRLALEMLPTYKSIDVVINAITRMTQGHEQSESPRGPLQGGYAEGGISTGPQSGHWELLHGTEAVIPLENGAVPVQMSGNNNIGGNTINVFLTVSPQGITILDESLTGDFLKPYVVQAVNEAQAEGLL